MRLAATIEIDRPDGQGDYSFIAVTVIGSASRDECRRNSFVMDDGFDLIAGDWRGHSLLPGLTMGERTQCDGALEARLVEVLIDDQSARENRAYDEWKDRHLTDRETP